MRTELAFAVRWGESTPRTRSVLRGPGQPPVKEVGEDLGIAIVTGAAEIAQDRFRCLPCVLTCRFWSKTLLQEARKDCRISVVSGSAQVLDDRVRRSPRISASTTGHL